MTSVPCSRQRVMASAEALRLERVPRHAVIVGVHLIGSRMGEQIGEAALWVGWETLPEDVGRFVHAHPTHNESLGERLACPIEPA